MKPSTALKRAVKIAGSQSALARACNVSPQAVQQWVSTGSIPVSRVKAAVSVCEGKLHDYDFRPDIFEKPKKGYSVA